SRFDRYVIEGTLGTGGMGEVYSALDTRLQRRVALKVLRASTDGTSRERTVRMLREARAAAALQHPHVAAVFDTGEASGTVFIAMELVRGRSLRSLLRGAPAAMAQRIRWLTHIARGLSAAHDAGIVHRDVKPENVIVTEEGVAKVLDFGI